MKKYLHMITLLAAMAVQAFGTTLLQDDFTGREPGSPVRGTSVQSGVWSKEYEGSRNWSFSYGEGFISGDEVASGVANRSLKVPFSVSEVPQGEDVLVFEVTADPSVFRKKPSFALQFGFGGNGAEEIVYTLQSTPSGASRCYAKYIDGSEKIHGLLGMTTVSKVGGPAVCSIEYNKAKGTVSLIVDGATVLSALPLKEEFGSVPTISSLSFRAIRSGTDTNGKALFSAFRLESRAADGSN